MGEPVVVDVTIAAPAERVWRALRDPVELRRWHGWEYDGIEDEIREIYLDGAAASDEDLTLETGAGRFELEPAGAGTAVRVVRAAPEGAESWDGTYDEINEGWRSFAEQLRFYLERHAGEDRRTLFLERETAPPAGGELWFDAEHQRGVLLDPRTLVIVARGKTIVSAYGVGDETFAALRERLDR